MRFFKRLGGLLWGVVEPVVKGITNPEQSAAREAARKKATEDPPAAKDD